MTLGWVSLSVTPCLTLSPSPVSRPQARIKAKAIAINTFVPKNGYRPVEVNPYVQQRYTSFYVPTVYGPPPHFPLYSLMTPQAWASAHTPGFIDPTLVGCFYRSLTRRAKGFSFIESRLFSGSF